MKQRIENIDNETKHLLMTGQVIYGLSSTIKELIENSIDAKASCIEVNFRKKGFSFIEVIDNGTGLSEDNYELFAKMHATSKIKDYYEIRNLKTYGFRGEAISSICASSKLVVITKTDGMSIGYRIEYDKDGNINKKEPVPRTKGTSVIVSDILNTLPVRQSEWQRNSKLEFRKALAVVCSYALCCNNVKIVCRSDCSGVLKVLFSTQGSGTLLRSIEDVYGVKTTTNIFPFSFNMPERNLICSGMVSDVGCGRNSTDQQFCFVNQRPVFITDLSRRINKAYREHGARDYPIVFLNLFLPTDSYDINITPDKKTILFFEEDSIFSFIQKSFSMFWEERKPTITFIKEESKIILNTESPLNLKKEEKIFNEQEKENKKVFVSENVLKTPVSIKEKQNPLPVFSVSKSSIEVSIDKKSSNSNENTNFNEFSTKNLKEDPVDVKNIENKKTIKKEDIEKLIVIGQFNRGFILVCLSNGLYILDQHAVDERINFEKYMKELRIDQQELINPIAVDLSIDEEVFVMENIELIRKGKFFVEIIEENQPTKKIIIKKMPVVYKHVFVEKDFCEFVGYLRNFSNEKGSVVIPRTNRIIASLACRRSIMIGDSLTKEKMKELIKKLSKLENPWSCPHGRPTIRFLMDI